MLTHARARGLSLPSLLVIAASIIFSGCSSAEPDVVSFEEADMFERVGTIEIQEDDERFIGTIRSLTVETDPLRLYIADRTMHRIAVLDSTGTIVQLIGQEGEGPGEMQAPVRVAVWGDSLVVENTRSELTVFTKHGDFVRRGRLPPDTWQGGRWSLTTQDGDLFMAVSIADPVEHGALATPELPVAARLNYDFSLAEMFGRYPDLYQEEEYTRRWTTLDFSPDGHSALGFALLPHVYIYDARKPEAPFVEKVVLDHPEFLHPPEPMPMGMPVSRIIELAPHFSNVQHTFILSDHTVVQTFGHGTEEFYADDTRPQEDYHVYASLGKVGSDETLFLHLPGQILARDDNDRLYVELNHRPDERTIGVYEVNWP